MIPFLERITELWYFRELDMKDKYVGPIQQINAMGRSLALWSLCLLFQEMLVSLDLGWRKQDINCDCLCAIFFILLVTLCVPCIYLETWGQWVIIPLLVNCYFWLVIICENLVDLHWILRILLAQKELYKRIQQQNWKLSN